MTFSRTAGFAALGFITCVVAANVALNATGLPSASAASSDVAAYFANNAAAVGFASSIAVIAWIFLTIFAAGALLRFLPVEYASGSGWSLVGFAGLLLQNAVFASVVATQLALVAGPSDAIWNLHTALFGVNGFGLVIALTGFSIAGRRTGLMRPWHWVIGLIAAVLLLASAALTPLTLHGEPIALTVASLLGFVLWLVWVTTFGVLLVRTRGTAAVTA